MARRLLGSRADAEDAVQRALLQCYTRRFELPAAVGRVDVALSHPHECVRGRAAAPGDPDRLRRLVRRDRLGASPRAPAGPGSASRARARAAEARVLLALRYAEGLSYGELAQIRGISVNTVKSQLARGKALLREELGKRGILHD